ncbi:MAG: bifunctional glutamate N-acetyltransferase/amino-acid acetyltransferase ArgJ [Nitrospinae bacterium]|nr:bifunctional glutamate N-acetyltransferase/amino-acid acetyltransferase ArgJ [Nitrospinota bacterium]
MSLRTGVTFAEGYLAGGTHCGVKKDGASKDLAIILSEKPAVVWGVFTTNRITGSSVVWSRDCLKSRNVQAIVVNSGNSNVLTRQGYAHTQRMARAVAKKAGVKESQVIVASTGVIGQPLPIEKVEIGIETLFPQISAEGGAGAAEAIMTTDIRQKIMDATLSIGGKTVKVGGCAKGAGMISPSMATMLAFVTTDAALTKPVIKDLTRRACEMSFNRITVDGDTSTSDMFVIMANGASGAPLIDKPSGKRYDELLGKVTGVCQHLAHEIVRDGEGATKFAVIKVTGAVTGKAAKQVGMSIAKSPLVKTALFGQDANWGRILCAAGYSGVNMSAEKLTLKIGGITVFAKGGLARDDWETIVAPKLKEPNVEISLDLGMGGAQAEVWTCDLTYDYIRINADYRT